MTKTGTGAQRVQRRRDNLRALGLRPVQIWVPDIRASGFAAECRRQARLVRDAEEHCGEPEAETWAEASDTSGWTG